jgi:hypothetical protein
MCTVTIVPHDRGVRLVSNRDERRTRPAGLAPETHDLGPRRALFPLDPQGGGTWVGVNDAGLIVALLNVTAAAPSTRARTTRSRGLIALELLRCDSMRMAIETARALDAGACEPFRALVVHAGHLAVAKTRANGTIQLTLQPIETPLLFTSSSLGDALVDRPRRRLFERMVLRAHDGWLDGQTRFHDHQWPQRPEISVRMERADALTVSRTRIDVTSDRRELAYEALVMPHTHRAEAPRCCSLR